MTVAAENDVDTRDGLGQRDIVLAQRMADQHYRVHMLLLAQRCHHLPRDRDAIGEHRAGRRAHIRANQALEVGTGQREHADLHATSFKHLVRLAIVLEQRLAGGVQRVGTQDRVLDRVAARGKLLWPIVGVVVAKGHRVDDAVEPLPLGAVVFVRPGRRAEVHHIAAAQDQAVRVVGVGLQVGDQPSDPGGVGLALGVQRHGVRVIVGEVQQRDGGARLRGGRRGGQGRQQNEDGDLFHGQAPT